MKESGIFKIFLFAVMLALLTGCSSKSDIVFYMPSIKSAPDSVKKADVTSFESASYLASDKIWYKKDGLFLHYSRSFLAKTPKEYLTDVLEIGGFDGKITIRLIDAYQLYGDSASSYLLTASVEVESGLGKKRYRMFNIKKDGFGIGPSEAVKGFEAAAYELNEKIKTEFGGKGK